MHRYSFTDTARFYYLFSPFYKIIFKLMSGTTVKITYKGVDFYSRRDTIFDSLSTKWLKLDDYKKEWEKFYGNTPRANELIEHIDYINKYGSLRVPNDFSSVEEILRGNLAKMPVKKLIEEHIRSGYPESKYFGKEV